MNRKKRTAAIAIAAVLLLALMPIFSRVKTAITGSGELSEKEERIRIREINSIEPDEDGVFRLLYSTVGYDSRATKRMLIRTVGNSGARASERFSRWSLYRIDGKRIAGGRLTKAPRTYGMDLWEIDFSDVVSSGCYYIKASVNSGLSFETLYSQIFEIRSGLLEEKILPGITVFNAEAREAPESLGGGYYDCNWSTMGEGYSHGVFLNGLAQTYSYYHEEMSSDMNKRYRRASERAFRYLLGLVEEDGCIDHQDPSRPNYQGTRFGIMNSQEAVYGMAAFMDIFSDDSLANEENYQKVLKVLEYVENTEPFGYQAGYDTYHENLIPVYLHLYNYSGDVRFRDKAIRILNRQLKNFNLRTMWRNSWRAIPNFEGLMMCVELFPEDEHYEYWMEQAEAIKDKYFDDLPERNAFRTVTSSTQYHAEEEWDDMASTPDGDPVLGSVVTQCTAAYCMDACILGSLTGDERMEAIATGQLEWILGLNPGLPQWTVQPSETNRDREAAALMGGLSDRSVTVRYNVWSPKNSGIITIVNGFSMNSEPFHYENRWNESESFIKWDGSYAYAICMYEKYLKEYKQGIRKKGQINE